MLLIAEEVWWPISGLATRELGILYIMTESDRPIIIIIIIMKFELHKRSEVWNALDKSTVGWSDREFKQGRTILFNVVIVVVLSAMAVEIFRKCVSSTKYIFKLC